MLELGFYLWIGLTLPIWLALSLILIFIKFIFYFAFFLYANVTFQIDNHIAALFRVFVSPFFNSDIIYEYFKDFYYDHTGWSVLIAFILIHFYVSSSQKNK